MAVLLTDKDKNTIISVKDGVLQVPNTLKTISASYILAGCFGGSSEIKSVSFPELTSVSGDKSLYACFVKCANLSSISFPKLTTVSGNNAFELAFAGVLCSAITFSSLTTISGDSVFYSAFGNTDKSSTDIYFPKLTSISSPSTAFLMAANMGVKIHFPKKFANAGILLIPNDYPSEYADFLGSFIYDL